ncbi:MAG: hypothetical protein IKD69_14155 [Solobacterium sp.]|nr:hypothetical protein [Solobacterium sp.]
MTREEFYETLSDEVKAKIKACSSEAEMMKVLEEEQIELAPELLDGVSGGREPCRDVCSGISTESCFCD